jgi:hypothetical protein
MGYRFDWTCSQCGARETWELVRGGSAPGDDAAARPAVARGTLDFTCSRCGATETYMLVRAGVHAR